MRIFNQKNIPWLGAFMDSLYVSLPILSIINFASILTILYANVFPWLQDTMPWLRFWNFVIIIGVLTIVMMAVVYKFVVPSLWTFRSKQMFKHESEVVDKLDALTKKVEELTEKLSK